MILKEQHVPGTTGMDADVLEISDPMRLASGPVVSVVMTAFNHAPYVAQSIGGVLKQETSFEVELIVAEDCSSDSTRDIAVDLQRRHPERIRVVTGAANIGGPANFRRAMKRARGRYIAFCEGDDYWIDPTKLERQVSMLDANPALSAVHTEFAHLISVAGKCRILDRFQGHFRPQIPSGEIFDQLVLGNFIQTCTLCIRTELVREYLQHPLSLRGNPVGDWPLCLFASARAGIAYVETPTAVYRRVPGSATNKGGSADIARARQCMAMIDDFCRYYGRPESLARASHARAHEHILYQSLLNGLAHDFRTSLQWLTAHDPSQYTNSRWTLIARLMDRGISRRALASLLKSSNLLREIRYYK